MTHRIVILGGGVGGTLLANLLARKLKRSEAEVTVVDETGRHVYQPGWLYLPFGEEQPRNLVKAERGLLNGRVRLVTQRATRIDAAAQRLELADGEVLRYETLVVATGARLAPETVPGFAEGAHHFYAQDAALALKDRARRVRRRPPRHRRRRHPLQMPAGAARIRLQGRGVPDASGACATRRRSSTSRRSTGSSRSRASRSS